MIVGISGKARSGKGEFAAIAVKEFGAVEVSFAGPLKEEVKDFLERYEVCFEHRHLYGENIDKEATLRIRKTALLADPSPESAAFLSNFMPNFGKSEEGNYLYFTPRALMQWYGSEYRRAQDPSYWVKKALSVCTKPKQLYVISDVRFQNEADVILLNGGTLIRVERPNRPEISNPNHPSEVGLDDWACWDYILDNGGDLAEYRELCKNTLEEIVGRGVVKGTKK